MSWAEGGPVINAGGEQHQTEHHNWNWMSWCSVDTYRGNVIQLSSLYDIMKEVKRQRRTKREVRREKDGTFTTETVEA